MIAILADDFSGAAEIAGIAAQRGLRAEVQLHFDPNSPADVIAVDCDSRSLDGAAAARRVASIASEVVAAGPEWIYKKTDSVMRGNVRAEIESILTALGKDRCLLIPANPSKGRVIIGGRYYINGVPLDQTVFAHDPDYPRRTSQVGELLDGGDSIVMPDVASVSELNQHVVSREGDCLSAGGADFFAALMGGEEVSPQRQSIERTLLICGSYAGWNSGRADEMRAQGFEVEVLPEEFYGEALNDAWIERLRGRLVVHQRLMLAIGTPAIERSTTILTESLVVAAAAVAREIPNLRLAIEGGATALALMQRCGWRRFEVLPEGLVGVGGLRVIGCEAPLLWVKPGSYPWPDGIFA